MPRNNEIKDTTKVIKSLENRGILLKGTTRKINGQKGGLLNFLGPLMRPTLKSCSFPIHRPGEIKNSHEPPAGRNIFFAISLSKKIYDKNT